MARDLRSSAPPFVVSSSSSSSYEVLVFQRYIPRAAADVYVSHGQVPIFQNLIWDL